MGVEIIDSGSTKPVETPLLNAYRTTDTEMAAALMSIGHKFVRLEEKRDKWGKKWCYVFAHNDVRDDLTKWLNGELRVDPRLLLNNYADLKNLINNKDFNPKDPK